MVIILSEVGDGRMACWLFAVGLILESAKFMECVIMGNREEE